MFYKNLLVYINGNVDIENELVEFQQVNTYKYPLYNFIQEIEKLRKEYKAEDDIEIFCILGKKDNIEHIKIKQSIKDFFERLQNDDIGDIINGLKEDVDNINNFMTQRFYDLYTSIIIENKKLKYPRIFEMKLINGITCLGLYFTSTPQEEKELEVNCIMEQFFFYEQPFFMGKQVMIQSFLLRDIVDRRILAVLPNADGIWYALLEGGIKLYLNDEIPYQREKISSRDVRQNINLEIDSMINNPCYSYKKFFKPYELFEEWNHVFMYALATLQIKYEKTTLELLYEEFLEFIEENICDVIEVEDNIISKELMLRSFMKNIEKIKEYIKGKDEVGISKNLLILLRSRYAYLPIIYKLISKYYEKEVLEKSSYTSFSKSRWEELLGEIDKGSSYNKGICMEDIANYFINCIEGLKVTKRRSKTENEEMDLVCCNVSENPELWDLGAVILIECKNWKNKVDTKVIRNLSYLMDKKGVSTLLLFAKSDITEGANKEVMKQAAHNKFIITFDLEDLYKIDGNILKPKILLLDKYTKLIENIEDRMELIM